MNANDERREASDWGYEDGINAAIDEVTVIVHELFSAGNPEMAARIHSLVWQRIRDRREPLIAARQARRARRDAEIARTVAESKGNPSS